jgi:hypothetical protein
VLPDDEPELLPLVELDELPEELPLDEPEVLPPVEPVLVCPPVEV